MHSSFASPTLKMSLETSKDSNGPETILVLPPLSPTLPVTPLDSSSCCFLNFHSYRKHSVLFTKKSLSRNTANPILDSLITSINQQQHQTPEPSHPYSSLLSTKDHEEWKDKQHPLVLREQAAYHQWAHNAVLANMATLNTLPFEAHQKANRSFEYGLLQSILNGLHSKEVLNIRLSSLASSPPLDFFLEHDLDVFQTGSIPELKLPSPGKHYVARLLSTKQEGKCITQDPIIDKIINMHPIDMVLTSSVLTCLISLGPDVSSDKHLKMAIKEVANKDFGNKKVAFILKPVKLLSSPRSQLSSYYKEILRNKLSTANSIQLKHADNNNSGLEQEDATCQEGNYIYNIWKFGKLKLLIRCKIFGCIPDENCPYGTHRYVGLQVKPEFRLNSFPKPAFPLSSQNKTSQKMAFGPKGLEQLSSVERAKWWLYTFVRPDAHLLLCRVDALQSQLISVETLKCKDIISEPHFIGDYAKILFHLLTAISSLTAGIYTLRYTRGSDFVLIHHWDESNEINPKEDSEVFVVTKADHPQCGVLTGTGITESEEESSCPIHPFDPTQTSFAPPPPFDIPPPLLWRGPKWQIPYTFDPCDLLKLTRKRKRTSRRSKKRKKLDSKSFFDEPKVSSNTPKGGFDEELKEYRKALLNENE